ncbi:MAG: hypothetical protein J6T41_00275, partial [Neisseriaceae bacterium]|nr:hypothetical protein [Neisseriaceae bacterium]
QSPQGGRLRNREAVGRGGRSPPRSRAIANAIAQISRCQRQRLIIQSQSDWRLVIARCDD